MNDGAEESLKGYLVGCVGGANVLCDELMSAHTTFRIGGSADYYVRPQSCDEAVKVIGYLRKTGAPYIVVGNGSNILVSDDGVRGVVVEFGDGLSDYTVEHGNDSTVSVRAGAGIRLAKLGAELAERGVGGFEFAAGIPGSIGGAVRMNAGAYGGEMKDIVESVKVLNSSGEVETVPADKMEFGYRTSRIAHSDLIVLEVTLRLFVADRESVRAKIKELASRRREKQPLEYPSAGSTFKRPEGYFAAKLIDDAGLRGSRVGDAQVSEKHAGFIVNRGCATAKDVCGLMDHVCAEVRQKFGVELEPEVIKVGF